MLTRRKQQRKPQIEEQITQYHDTHMNMMYGSKMMCDVLLETSFNTWFDIFYGNGLDNESNSLQM